MTNEETIKNLRHKITELKLITGVSGVLLCCRKLDTEAHLLYPVTIKLDEIDLILNEIEKRLTS